MRKIPMVLALCALLALPLAGCYKVRARAELQEGNKLFKVENYKEALAQFQKGIARDPSATFAWRSVGLCAMALYRPGIDSPDNLKYADIAIDAFQRYLRVKPDDSRTEDYLVTTWINAGRFDQAINYLKTQRLAHPENIKLNTALVTVMLKATRYAEALDWVNSKARNDAQLYFTIGSNAWSKSYNDPTTAYEDRVKIVDLGIQATQRAVEIKPDFWEAMGYYNLLYRERAKLDLDPKQKEEWIKLADEWRAKAVEVKDRLKGSSVSLSSRTKSAS